MSTFSSRVGGVLLAAMGFVALEGAAQAQAPEKGFALNRFEASERGSEWFANESLDLRGKYRPAFGLVVDGQYRPLVVYDANKNIIASPVRNVGTLNLGGSLNLFDRLRLGLNLPIVLFQDGHQANFGSTVIAAPASDQALGDLRFTADFRIFGTYGDPFTVAVGAQMWFPTGSADNYTSDESVRVAPRVIAAGDVGEGAVAFVYSAKIGVMLGHPERYFGATKLGQEFTFSAAAGVRLANKHLVVGPELYGSTVFVSNPSQGAPLGVSENDRPQTPVEGILGAHYTAGMFRVGVGGGLGLSRGYGSPERRWLVDLELMPTITTDTDGDGIDDKDDACVTTPGVKSSDPRKNGCPPDRDNDGILDQDDACVDVPGVKSDDRTKNGCPLPPDDDKDGIPNAADACPTVPGVPNADATRNGCPPDKDGDGVYDTSDACIDVPGVKTDDPKTNGCPPDQDADGILDVDDSCPEVKGVASPRREFNGCPPDLDSDTVLNEVDACPREAGKPDPDPTRNGCPKAFVQGGVIKILDQVKFKTGSADILPGKDSEEVLQAVLKVMTDHADIKKVRVEGHTDNQGNPAFNKKLSGDRAASVVKWLVAHGVDKARLTSQGFGLERPMADNKNEEGRRQNRRVEFHIENDDGTTGTTVQTPTAPTPAPAPPPAPKPAPPPPAPKP